MRLASHRKLLALPLLAGIACGIDRAGSGPLPSPDVDAGTDSSVVPIADSGQKDSGSTADTATQDVVVEDVADTGVLPADFPSNLQPLAPATGPDLVDPITIDTDALTVNGAAFTPFARVIGAPPALFTYAVLQVNNLTIGQPLRVRGGYPLIIVAKGDVNVNQTISAGGVSTEPGPGGGALRPDGGLVGTQSGVGGNGAVSGADRGGAGGAGHSTAGAAGIGPGMGAAGVAFGSSVLAPLYGGSQGGAGSLPSRDPMDGGPCGYGGAGGGGLQISAYGKIAVAAGFFVDVGGGGGQGGCSDNSGAGGGSGGTIVLEALSTLTIGGGLVANGGGGSGAGNADNGVAGSNGLLSTAAAPGGAGGDAATDRVGGAGGALGVAPKVGLVSGGGKHGGGGGGATGRIFLRHRPDGGLSLGPSVLASPAFVPFPLN